ncbi:CDP-glucose 4,6-dehydratase [Alicyclobacillus dauci]|uniref:CDP-glucose 4,6-dehydratase n=1 Tax=Alicyclobacillus dauci TaxID=1475485 RepID=A0ABY6Z5Y9_9BACL|nr:CDP-glucose 4,6-dehydratase [Alicyclobacillus dauci]WAH37694.1 CDP-glucose 4,6-dehydratase [Alicyclobacillus dauci]
MTFWSGKRVLITGHTGFKGSWLSLWLRHLGATVTGYSLDPPTETNLFSLAKVAERVTSIKGDIRDEQQLVALLKSFQPEIVFHMAAQSLVRKSYDDPIRTFDTNVMGTVHVLNALRVAECLKVVINVTSDKCYENKEWPWEYRENDPFGGYDPYSSSKACAEIVTAAFRRSFFSTKGVHLASVRAGNVIGGGDWAEDRLVPDIIRACIAQRQPTIRNPNSIRPWQHVLEPLEGYMILAEALWNLGEPYAEGWNFGPNDENVLTVREMTHSILELWGTGAGLSYNKAKQPHEANMLRLDSSKARLRLGWRPKLNLITTLEWTVDAYKRHYDGQDISAVVMEQIQAYENIRG